MFRLQRLFQIKYQSFRASSVGYFVGLALIFFDRFAILSVTLNIVVELLLRCLAFFARCVVCG